MTKQLRTLVLATTVGVSVMSCSKQPTACFDADPSTAQVGESINLDASCSIEAEQYIWSDDSSNGASSYSPGGTESQQQTVTFDTPGTYEITLTVENGKKTDETTRTITVQ